MRRLVVCVSALISTLTILALGNWLHAEAPGVPSNTWAATADMSMPRAGAAASLVYDGTVLISGGKNDGGIMATAERYNPATGTFVAMPSMQFARANHTSTLLSDGRVLVTGGVGAAGTALSSTEVYDPATNAWHVVGPMNVARSGQTATALYDGRVAIVGGDDSGNSIASIEVFDPWAERFDLVPITMSTPRTGHAAALTHDGFVVIAGGYDGATLLASIETFDPFLNTITPGPQLATARAGLTATTLLDGRVLLLGGLGPNGELGSGEILDPRTNAIGGTDNEMRAPRQRHQAVLLPHNNGVLIVGGTQNGSAVPGAELYIAWQGTGGTIYQAPAPALATTWSSAAALSYNASLTIRSGPNDGLLLLAGGSATANASSATAAAELYGFATVKTDRADYSPGSHVAISGSGWQPGEVVTLILQEEPAFDQHAIQPVVADSNGNIYSSEFVPDPEDAGVRFYLTATGSASQVQTSFTDAVDGAGILTVDPASVAAGSSGNTLVFVFNNNTAAAFSPGSYVGVTVPAGWTMPQNSDPTAAGYVTVSGCASSIASIASGTITVNQTCGPNASMAIRYGDRSAGGAGVTAHTTPGTYTFNATSQDGAAGGVALVTGSPVVKTFGAATRLAFVQQPLNSVMNSLSPLPITVEIQDATGQRVTSNNVFVNLALGANPGAGILSGTKSRLMRNGLVTFDDLSISAAGNGYTLIAASSGLTGATSAPFDVAAQANCTWVGGTTGNWNDATRWNCGGVARIPTFTDIVIIDTNGATVSIPSGFAAVAYNVYIGAPGGTNTSVTLSLASASSSLTAEDVLLFGPAGTNTRSLLVNDGTVNARFLEVGPTGIGTFNPTFVSKVSVSNGTINAGVLLLEAPANSSPLQAQLDMSGGAGTVNAGEFGLLNADVGTLTPSTTSTVNINRTNPFVYSSDAGVGRSAIVHNHLISTAVDFRLNAAVTPGNLKGNVRVLGGGDLNDAGFTIAGGPNQVFELADSAQFDLSALAGLPTGFGTRTLGVTSTVAYENGFLNGTGTITTQTATSGVTGTGTLFLTQTPPGTSLCKVDGSTVIGRVASVTSNTSLTLISNALSTNSGLAFTRCQPIDGEAYGNLTISTGPLTKTLLAPATVAGTLSLGDARIVTGTNELSVTSVSNASVTRASGFVIGSLKKVFGVGASQSFTFPVGTDASTYSPVRLSNLAVTAAGALTATATPNDSVLTTNPGSGLNVVRDVNRSWNLTRSAQLAASAYDVSLTYLAGDIDAGSTESAFVLRKLANGSWSAPPGGTTVNTATHTVTGAGLTSFSDFAIGEALTASRLSFVQQPTNTVSGQAITPAITVRIEDAGGNLIPSDTRNVTLAIASNPAAGVLSGTATVAAVAGLASFGNLSIDKAGTGYTLTASASGVSAATSAAFSVMAVNTTTSMASNPTVTYGDANVALSASVAANSPSTAVVGEGTVTFTVKDGSSNTVGVPVTSGIVVGGSATASFGLTGVAAGTYSIYATYNPAASAPNFNTSTTATPGTLTVGRAATTTIVSFEAGPYTYRGSPFVATAVVSGVAGLNQAVPVNYVGDCVNVTSPNGCTAIAAFAGDPNYAPSGDSRSITLTKASASVSPNAASKTYKNSDPALNGTLHGFLASDSVTASYSRTAGETVLGSPYTISATLTAPPNLLTSSPVSAGGDGFVDHACAVKFDGTVACWGSDSPAITVPAGLTGVTALSAGNSHTCAVKSDGSVTCWGGNALGQSTVPAALSAIRIGAGAEHTCALKTDGTVACWGRNVEGQTNVPAGLGTVSQLAAGNYHNCVVKTDATVSCWGTNTDGQLNVPAGLGTVRSVAAGGFHTCAAKTDGTVSCWGNNGSTQLNVPAGLNNVKVVTAGYAYSCGIKTDDSLVCWGYQGMPPGDLGQVIAADGGRYLAACAVKTNGTPECWGYGPVSVPAGVVTATAGNPLDNYDVTYNTAAFTINPRAASVTPAAKSKIYGAADPSLTGSLLGFIAADAVTATYSRTAGESVAGSPYTISATLSPAAVLSNYSITYNVANFTITKANATVTVTPYTVTYDGLAHTAAITTIAGVNGETGATVGTVDVSQTTHTTVGTYSTDSWTFTGAGNYNNIAATPITDRINKASATVTVNPYTVPYDGQAHTATYVISGVNGESGATVGTVALNTTHTNAGTYSTDSWSFTGAGNYNNIASTMITDTITKANATVNVTPYTVTYDGHAHTATYTISGLNSETGATVGTVTLNTTHTNAGTYDNDSWSFTGAGNYKDIATTTITDAITKASSTTTTVSLGPFGYDGATHTGGSGTVTGVGGLNTSATSVTYTGDQVNAGTYYATAHYAGDANHDPSDGAPVGIVINKATATISVVAFSGIYDGTPHGVASSVATGVNTETLAGLVVDPATYTDVPGGQVHWTFTNANYADQSGVATVSIAEAPSVTAVSCPTSVPYNGAPQTPCSTTITGAGGLTLTPVPTYANNINAGTASANYHYSGDVNHSASSDSKTFMIAKATSTTTVLCPTSVSFDGHAHTPCTATVTGAAGLSESVDVDYVNNINAGTASATATYAGDANHAYSADSKSFDIAKAQVTATAGGGSATFDGIAKSPSACAVTGAYIGDVTCTNNPPSVGPGAGTTAILPVVSGSLNNFSVHSVNGSYTIGQATSTTTVNCPPTVTYNGSPQTPCSATTSGALGPLSSQTVAYTNNVNAGTASATASFVGDTNYTGSTGSNTFTIAKADQTISFGALANKVVGDAPFTVTATGGGSGNPVVFITTTPAVCTSGGANGSTITIVAAGGCTVQASEGGNVNYNVAPDVHQSFVVQNGTTFSGLFNPWAPPGPGTYNGMTFTSGTVYKVNSTLPVKWGYSVNGVLIDSSRANGAQYPVVNIYGPLAQCGEIDGTGSDTVVSFTGPGSTTTTYDTTTKTWQRNVKLDGSFQGDKCYVIQVYDPVTNTNGPAFPIKTKK